MSVSWLRIGPNRYECSGAKVIWVDGEDGPVIELYSFDPLTVDEDFFDTHGGATINGVPWKGVASLSTLPGRTLVLTVDEYGELAESVFWQKGINLDITRLELNCLDLSTDSITLSLRAALVNYETDEELDAEGMMRASLNVR